MNTNSLTNTGNTIADQASAALEHAGDLSHRGAEAVRDGVQQVRDKAHNLSGHAVDYIRDEPVKSVLIAAAAGATLMGLLSLMVRGAGRG